MIDVNKVKPNDILYTLIKVGYLNWLTLISVCVKEVQQRDGVEGILARGQCWYSEEDLTTEKPPDDEYEDYGKTWLKEEQQEKTFIPIHLKNELILRELLWLQHKKSNCIDGRYLECTTCQIDFKNMSPDDIKQRFGVMGIEKMLEKDRNHGCV